MGSDDPSAACTVFVRQPFFYPQNEICWDICSFFQFFLYVKENANHLDMIETFLSKKYIVCDS